MKNSIMLFLIAFLSVQITAQTYDRNSNILISVDCGNDWTDLHSIEPDYDYTSAVYLGNLRDLGLTHVNLAYGIDNWAFQSTGGLALAEFEILIDSISQNIIFYEGDNWCLSGERYYYKFADYDNITWFSNSYYGKDNFLLPTPGGAGSELSSSDACDDFWGLYADGASNTKYWRTIISNDGDNNPDQLYNTLLPMYNTPPGNEGDAASFDVQKTYHLRLRMRVPNLSLPPSGDVCLTLRIYRAWLDASDVNYYAVDEDILDYQFSSNGWTEIHYQWTHAANSLFGEDADIRLQPYGIEILFPDDPLGINTVDLDQLIIEDQTGYNLSSNFLTSDEKQYMDAYTDSSNDIASITNTNKIDYIKVADEPYIFQYPIVEQVMKYYNTASTGKEVLSFASSRDKYRFPIPELFADKIDNQDFWQFVYPFDDVAMPLEHSSPFQYDLIQDELHAGEDAVMGMIPQLRDAVELVQGPDSDYERLLVFIQTHGSTDFHLSTPSGEQIRVMANLALCYGAKGIIYFGYDRLDGETHYSGFLEDEIPSDHRNSLIWDDVKNQNLYIKSIESELVDCNWKEAYSIDIDQILSTEEYLHTFQAYSGGSLRDQEDSYLEVGFFEDGNDRYVMMVNRDPDTAYEIDATFNNAKHPSSLNNYVLTDVSDGDQYYSVSHGNNFTSRIPIPAGEARFFKVQPVYEAGYGILSLDESDYSSTVTVPSGETLTINAGVDLSFSNSSNIHVYGTLDINGTSSNRVTIDFNGTHPYSAKGIYLRSGSSADIDYMDITSEYRGITNSDGSLYLDNSTITATSTSIYGWSTDVMAVNACQIGGGDYGIICDASELLITDSDVDDNDYRGIWLTNGGSMGYSYSHNNRITASNIGIYADNSSASIAEIPSGEGNAIPENSLTQGTCVTVDNGGIVDADNHYWGPSPSASDFNIINGSVDWTPFYTTDQTTRNLSKSLWEMDDSSPSLSIDQTNGKESEKDLSPAALLLETIFRQLSKEQWQGAAVNSHTLVKTYTESVEAFAALRILKYLASKDLKILTKAKFQDILTQKRDHPVFGFAELYLSELEDERSISKLNEIANSYSSDMVKSRMLYEQFVHYYWDKQDEEKASGVFEQLKQHYPESGHFELADYLLNGHKKTPVESARRTDNMKNGMQLEEKESETAAKEAFIEEVQKIPEEFELEECYPNPFNPSTTFAFGLPVNSNVQINIYDISGRLLEKVADRNYSAGYHNIVWNSSNSAGQHFSSGVYLYTYIIQPNSGEFAPVQKSGKLLLVK